MLLAGAACAGRVVSAAPVDPADHAHEAQAASKQAKSLLPGLRILMPAAGDVLGTQVGIVIETPADLAKWTMGSAPVGTHLHVQIDDTTLMPAAKDFVRMGRNRYLFLFDMPAAPGAHTLRVYWSGARHETFKDSVREVSVRVAAETPQ
jgi:hypothetical protein